VAASSSGPERTTTQAQPDVRDAGSINRTLLSPKSMTASSPIAMPIVLRIDRNAHGGGPSRIGGK